MQAMSTLSGSRTRVRHHAYCSRESRNEIGTPSNQQEGDFSSASFSYSSDLHKNPDRAHAHLVTGAMPFIRTVSSKTCELPKVRSDWERMQRDGRKMEQREDEEMISNVCSLAKKQKEANMMVEDQIDSSIRLSAISSLATVTRANSRRSPGSRVPHIFPSTLLDIASCAFVAASPPKFNCNKRFPFPILFSWAGLSRPFDRLYT